MNAMYECDVAGLDDKLDELRIRDKERENERVKERKREIIWDFSRL